MGEDAGPERVRQDHPGDRGCVHEDSREFADVVARPQARDLQSHEEEADLRLEPGTGPRDCKISVLTFSSSSVHRKALSFHTCLSGSYRAFSTRESRSRAMVFVGACFLSFANHFATACPRTSPSLANLEGALRQATIPYLDGLLSSKAGRDSGFL